MSGRYDTQDSSTSQGDSESATINAKTERRMVEQAIKIQDESWIKSYWRPAMGWLYMLICFADFVVFPALTMVLPAMLKGIGVEIAYTAWSSLTLANGGLIHLAFGAILGVAAYSRGQEKIAGSQ